MLFHILRYKGKKHNNFSIAWISAALHCPPFPSTRPHPCLIHHTPTSPASIFGFKGSESARRTEGYALVLVIAQRASVINNKGLWRTQGLWDASLVHATQVKDKTVISIPKMWPLQLQLHLNNTNRVRARRCDASLLALHERLIDIGYGVHALQHISFLKMNSQLKESV